MRRLLEPALVLLAAAVIAAACARPPTVTSSAVDPSRAPAWVGPTWALVEIQSMDDQVLTPGAPDRFTLRFHADGGLDVGAHCNRGRGTWRSEAPGQLQIGPIAGARASCGPGSLHDRFLSDLSYVRSYVFRDGRLHLATRADGAILEFRRLEEVEGADPGGERDASSQPSFISKKQSLLPSRSRT